MNAFVTVRQFPLPVRSAWPFRRYAVSLPVVVFTESARDITETVHKAGSCAGTAGQRRAG